MAALPRYVSRVNPAAPVASRPSRKRNTPEAETNKQKEASGSARAKKSKDREAPVSTRAVSVGPSAAVVEDICKGKGPAVDEAMPDLAPSSPPRSPAVVDLPLPSPPRLSSVPHSAPIKNFPRGLAWEKGLTEGLDVAFLPPGPFMDSRGLCPVDETTVHEVQKHLCKAIGLNQALLHLKGKYALAEAERLRLKRAEKEILAGKKALEEAEATKKALSEAEDRLKALTADILAGKKAMEEAEMSKKALVETEAKLKALTIERDVAQASSGKATEELLLVRESLEKLKSDCSDLREAHSQSMEAVRSLQSQRTELSSQLASAKEALAAEQAAHRETNDMLTEMARDCFQMALAQIQHLNPGVSLNLTGYDYRAYVLDGVMVLPPPTLDEGSWHEEPAEQGDGEDRDAGAKETVGEGAHVTAPVAEASAPDDKA